MASVELDTLWLNDMADLSDYQSFPMMSALTIKPVVVGGVRGYANGRRRAITQPGRFVTASGSLPACTREQMDWLEEHTGRPVLVRDDRGRKFYGIYLEADFDEHAYDDEADAALTIAEISHSEEV